MPATKQRTYGMFSPTGDLAVDACVRFAELLATHDLLNRHFLPGEAAELVARAVEAAGRDTGPFLAWEPGNLPIPNLAESGDTDVRDQIYEALMQLE